jgi:hypothetical protein
MILFIEISRAAAAADLGMLGDKVTMRGVRASRPRARVGLFGVVLGICASSNARWLYSLHGTRAGAPAPHERHGCYTFSKMYLSRIGCRGVLR